jgi:hypothetical protein
VNYTKTHLKVQGIIIGLLLVVPLVSAFLMWMANGHWTDTPGAPGPSFAAGKVINVRYISVVLVTCALVAPIFYFAKKRPPGTPLTWGEAMVAATYVFGLLFWLYGVVPHEFLTWADAELGWRPDRRIIGPDGTWVGFGHIFHKIPLTVTKQVIRDILAVHIYAVGLGGFMWMCKFWNDRQKNMDKAKAIEPVSTYGRPLVTKAGKA